MSISAADVKKLRDMTGAGMMDAKKALSESNGDFDNAVKYLREKGLADSKKRADKEANQGTIGDYIHCLLYTSPSPRDGLLSRMPSSA